MVEVLKKLSFDPYNGNHSTLKARIKADNLDLSIFKSNYSLWIKTHLQKAKVKKTLCEILVENSNYSRVHLKKRLINEGLKSKKCDSCGIADEWNGHPLSLQLDHINGINNDNRLENLRILCPNCHSQSLTYGGRNARKEKVHYFCSTCNAETSGYSNLCPGCSRIKKLCIKKEDLEKYVKEMPFTKIGKILNVSDNTVKNCCVSLGIPIYPKGYWTRRNAGYTHELSINPPKLIKNKKKIFTIEALEQIKSLMNEGLSSSDIAKRFGVSRHTIQRIRSGTSYVQGSQIFKTIKKYENSVSGLPTF